MERTCKYPYRPSGTPCGEPTRMRYPGDDPENGPARPQCRHGHMLCEGGCGVWVGAHDTVCSACAECRTCRDVPRPSSEGCPECGCPPEDWFIGQQGPDSCALCGWDVEAGPNGVVRTVDLDPGSAECGPMPDIQECLCHVTCPSGPKAWEEVECR